LTNALRVFLVLVRWSSESKASRIMFVCGVLAGLITGASNVAIIAVINLILAKGLLAPLLWRFAGLCAVIFLSGLTSQNLMMRLVARATRDLRIKLSRQILSVPYRQLEQLGVHRILCALTDDITVVAAGFGNLAFLGTQLAVMTACLVYLGWLSWRMLIVVLACMVVGIFCYHVPSSRSARYFHRMREFWDVCFKSFRAITEGIKELKLNRERRRAFMAEQLEPAIKGVYRHEVIAETIAHIASSGGQTLFFVLIGLILIIAPRLAASDHQALTGYTLTILFMITPLSAVLYTIPAVSRAHVAAEKVNALGLSLTAHCTERDAQGEALQPWKQLRLSAVAHLYQCEGNPDKFRLGPFDLVLYPREVVFLIGGNGSGKTTLAKLLIGLYEPDEGTIALDGTAITSDNRDNYRELFSVVFSDCYLFENLYGVDNKNLKVVTEQYLRDLRLSSKVAIEGSKLSTIDLSQGQRKRLALLSAYLEDRPIYVFDEWASDQDPEFKHVFYYEILPDLKAKGKTVIVISHDDHYYNSADRIIKLDNGQVEYDRRIQRAAPSENVSIAVAPLA